MIQSFKGALHEVLFNSPVKAKEIAYLTGKDYNRLANAANDSQQENLPGKDIVPVTIASRNDALIEFISSAVGGVFIRLPKMDLGGLQGEVSKEILDMVTFLGKLSNEFVEAMQDCTIDKDEAGRMEKILMQIVQHSIALSELIARQVGR